MPVGKIGVNRRILGIGDGVKPRARQERQYRLRRHRCSTHSEHLPPCGHPGPRVSIADEVPTQSYQRGAQGNPARRTCGDGADPRPDPGPAEALPHQSREQYRDGLAQRRHAGKAGAPLDLVGRDELTAVLNRSDTL